MSAADDILVLLAAGSARRMQAVVDDKITALLAGKPVFVAHSFGGFPTMLAASKYGDRMGAAATALTRRGLPTTGTGGPWPSSRAATPTRPPCC